MMVQNRYFGVSNRLKKLQLFFNDSNENELRHEQYSISNHNRIVGIRLSLVPQMFYTKV
jgi:hypothetical protein